MDLFFIYASTDCIQTQSLSISAFLIKAFKATDLKGDHQTVNTI